MNANTSCINSIFREYSSRTGTFPPQGRYLFQQARYLLRQPEQHLLAFDLWNGAAGRSEAVLHLFVEGREAVSPWRATFGGLDAPGATPRLLDEFLGQLHLRLAASGIVRVRLTNAPHAYDPPASGLVAEALLRHGYRVAVADTNYHLDLHGADAEARFHASERRRLAKCRRAGMVFGEETHADPALFHAFVQAARHRKGYPMTLGAEAFARLFADLPGTYRVFTARLGGTLAALTVTVRISPDILYTFYPADHADFLAYSPTVFITAELARLARQEGYALLDLGTATQHGIENAGLARFKRRLGALPSARLTFVREFAPGG